MKLLHVLAIGIALIMGIFWYSSNSVAGVSPCPHPNFIANHLCAHCRTLDDAADFSKYRPYPTGRNSVFFGRPAFEEKTYLPDRCGNVDSVPAAVCTSSGPNKYTCTWLGKACYAEHSIRNGHLFYNAIKCF